jgi:hypothetical protein
VAIDLVHRIFQAMERVVVVVVAVVAVAAAAAADNNTADLVDHNPSREIRRPHRARGETVDIDRSAVDRGLVGRAPDVPETDTADSLERGEAGLETAVKVIDAARELSRPVKVGM